MALAVRVRWGHLLENNRKDSEKYVCPCCDYLLRDAVQQMSCGHWLCEPCAVNLSEAAAPRCPRKDCLELWNINEVPSYFPDRFVRKSLGKFSTRCIYDDCSWIGVVEQLLQHLTECEYKKTECKLCKALLTGSEVKSHKDVCAGTMTPCYFAGLGCDQEQKMTMEQLTSHLTEEGNLVEHFEMIANCLKKINMVKEVVEKDEVEKDGKPSSHNAWAVVRSAVPAHKNGYNYPKEMEMTTVVSDGPEEGAVGGSYSRYSQQDMLQLHADKLAARYVQQVVGYKREVDGVMDLLTAKDSEIARLNSKVLQMEKFVQSKSTEGEDRDFRLSLIENSNYDGTMIWKIPQFSQRMEDARSGKYTSIFSLPFHSSRYGYKMCLRLYILGDGIGKGTHMSLFFVVMKGEFDAILQWPFTHKVSFRLLNLNHGRDTVDLFQPDPMSSSFQRPKTDMNIASGCPRFIPLTELNQGGFMEDNTIFIKVKVDTVAMNQH